MNWIIIGDKYQKGMKSKGCSGLIPYKNKKNIFEHQYDTIKKSFPNSNIIYITGFESKRFINFLKNRKYIDVTIVNNPKYNEFNDVYSLLLVKNLLNQETFINCGYTIFTKKKIQKFNTNLGTQIFINKTSKNQELGCIIQDGVINNISFDLPNEFSGIYYLSKEDTLKLKSLLNVKYKNYFIFEMINKLLDTKSYIKPFFI